MIIWVNKVSRMIWMWVRMWRMEKVAGHGLRTANRPAGRPARRRNIFRWFSDCTPQLILWKSIIGRFSKKLFTLYGVWRSFPISKVDPWLILLTEKEGFGGFEADRLRDRILSTQRFRRGRGRDFIYTKNVARPRSGFYLRNEFRAAGVRFYLHKRFMGPVLIRIY